MANPGLSGNWLLKWCTCGWCSWLLH